MQPPSPPTAVPPPALSVRSASSTTNEPAAAAPRPKTVSLARRLLFPALLAGAPLPPLLDPTAAAASALDEELWDVIALALRAFVSPFWGKLSRYDRDFLPRVAGIIAHVLRVLAARLAAADVPALALRALPTLLAQHVRDARAAAAARGTAYANGGAAGVRALFHARQPHMALNADGTLSDEYVRHALDAVLRACLPPEDYAPETERAIVREVLGMVVGRAVLPKVSQPWFIQKIVLDALGPPPAQAAAHQPADAVSAPPRKTFSLHALVIVILSAVQSVSGFFLAMANAYKHVRDTVKLVNAAHEEKVLDKAASVLPEKRQASFDSQATELPPTPGGMSSATPPILRSLDSYMSTRSSSLAGDPPAYTTTPESISETQDYAAPALDFVAELLTLRSRHASAALLQLLQTGTTAAQPFLDKFLPYAMRQHALGTPQALLVVRSVKRALFPNGYPAPAVPDPTPEEQAAIRTALVKRILERIPTPAAKILLGPDPTRTVQEAIDPFSDQACNVHLLVFILDLVLLTLFPELGIGGADAEGSA